MRLQKQPNNWSCLPTSFAMVLDIDVAEIFTYLGHDGSEIVFSHLVEDKHRRRGFHIAEMLNFCFYKGFACLHTYPVWESTPNGLDIYRMANPNFEQYCQYYNGVMTGVTEEGNRHACAYYDRRYYDPTSGEMYSGRFSLENMFIIYPLKVI